MKRAWQLLDSDDEGSQSPRSSLQDLDARPLDLESNPSKPEQTGVLTGSWVEKVQAAYKDVLEALGPQTRPCRVMTSCSGTGCPTLCLQDRKCGSEFVCALSSAAVRQPGQWVHLALVGFVCCSV